MNESLFSSRSWEVLREGYWSAQPSLLLCGDLAKEGVLIAAIKGVCPVHGGDGCLFVWVELRAARTQVTALTQQVEGVHPYDGLTVDDGLDV